MEVVVQGSDSDGEELVIFNFGMQSCRFRAFIGKSR